jgi:rSAM/selenodomain-associated transferase 1
MSIKHLVILVKNPIKGKVKHLLSKEIGEEYALVIYDEMLHYTASISKPVMAHRKCYYSEYVINNDMFEDEYFEKHIQKGASLGERMFNACKDSFGEWAEKVVVIGNNCVELNSGNIAEAFKALDTHDFVLGPTLRGGYYLLGMKQLHRPLFENKIWGSENVFLDTLLDITSSGFTHYLLPTLRDIEILEDLPQHLKELLTDDLADDDDEEDDF